MNKYSIGETVLIDGHKEHFEVVKVNGYEYSVAMLDPSPKDLIQVSGQLLRPGFRVSVHQIKPIYTYDLRKPI